MLVHVRVCMHVGVFMVHVCMHQFSWSLSLSVCVCVCVCVCVRTVCSGMCPRVCLCQHLPPCL